MSAISKSIVRAMRCETFFAQHYLVTDSPFRRLESPLALVGREFHAYRAAYIHHLKTTQKPMDKAWAHEFVREAGFLPASLEEINKDIPLFTINPQTIRYAELFLSIDTDFDPLEKYCGGFDVELTDSAQAEEIQPGFVSEHPSALLSGTLDQLDIDGETAYVNDIKSGWATNCVADEEPPLYAALVFAHYPEVQTVEFAWEFVRWKMGKAARYTRDDLEWIHQLIRNQHARRDAIAHRYADGHEMTFDQFAGLCTFCAIRCPMRVAVEMGTAAQRPIQTEEDARAVAALYHAADIMREKAKAALGQWANEHGPLDLGGNFVLAIDVKAAQTRPLVESLRVLGIDTSELPETSPRYSVPLGKLTVGNLSGYEDTKKRIGLAEEIRDISTLSPRTYVTVKRRGE